MNIETRLLFERVEFEERGLYPYVFGLLERRWRDPSLSAFIYALANSKSSPQVSGSASGDRVKIVQSIGNPAYICSIILTDPGHPTVLAIMNREYAFVKHCLPDAPNSSVPIAIIAQQKDNATIVAIEHNQMTRPGIQVAVAGIPRHVIPILNGVLRTYGAGIMKSSADSATGNYNFVIQTMNKKTQEGFGSLDFFPLLRTSKTMRNFDPYLPSIWAASPRSPSPGSSPNLTGHNGVPSGDSVREIAPFRIIPGGTPLAHQTSFWNDPIRDLERYARREYGTTEQTC